MSGLKCFKLLLLLENFFGIFRNYCCQTNLKKCLIVFQIVTQTILYTIVIFYELSLLLGDDYNQINLVLAGFFTSAYLCSLASVVTGVCYSHSFQSYCRSCSRVSEWFKDDKMLLNSSKKASVLSVGFILYSVAFATFRSVDTYLKFSHLNPVVLSILLVAHTLTRMSVVFEHYMLFFVIMIVVQLFKCLTSLVSAVQERVGRSDITSDEHCVITREQIQGWRELYQDLAMCCEQVRLCYGQQFLISIVLSIFHYVLMAYYMFYKNILNIGNTAEYTRIGIVLFAYVSVMMMPLTAGQLARNQGMKFHRVLVRLYNTMIIDSGEVETKPIKDFIRLIKKNPIEIKLLANIPAGMYLMPVMVTLTVNYVIIMLQFNHII